MKRWFRNVGIGILALVGVHKVQPTQIKVNPAPVVVAASPTATPKPIATTQSGVPELIPGKITATDVEVKMINQGFTYANIVLASDCFKNAVLASNFTENNGLNASEIWGLLSKGAIKVDVEMYTGSFTDDYVYKTIGYENDSEPNKVYSNRHFVDSAYMVGDNIMHEGEGHSQGFHHYQVKSTSVPYGMNEIFEKCADKSWD